MSVYMIRAGENGPVKIGHSSDPCIRLGQLQISHWEKLRIIRLLDGNEVEEAALHERFADLHIRGEWHAFSRAMLGDVGLEDVAIPEDGPRMQVVVIDPVTGRSRVGRPWTEDERAAAGERQRAITADPVRRAQRQARLTQTLARKATSAPDGRLLDLRWAGTLLHLSNDISQHAKTFKRVLDQ